MTAKTKTQVSRTTNGAEDAQRAQALGSLEERAAALESEAHRLFEQVMLARGTAELPKRPAGEYAVHAPITSSTGQLYARVQAALTDKPYTFRDLCVHLGITSDGENRVKSVIVRLQRDGLAVVNLGDRARAIWWIDTHNRIAAIIAERRARK